MRRSVTLCDTRLRCTKTAEWITVEWGGESRGPKKRSSHLLLTQDKFLGIHKLLKRHPAGITTNPDDQQPINCRTTKYRIKTEYYQT